MSDVVIRRIIIGIPGPEGLQGPQGVQGVPGQDGDMTGPDIAVEGNIAIFGETPSDLDDSGASVSGIVDSISALDAAVIKRDGSNPATADISLGSHKLTNVSDPTNPGDASNKAYTDLVAAGLAQHLACAVATTGNITLSGEQTLDTTVLTSTSRVLVWKQTDPIENGIYVSAAGAWARASDMPAAGEASGFVPVTGGTTNGNTIFVIVTTSGNPIIGTDNSIFTKYLTSATYSSTAGVAQSGNVFSLALSYAAIWTAAQAIRTSGLGGMSVESTDAGASAGPSIDVYRDSASPAASDALGVFNFYGRDSAGNKQLYALIGGRILDATSTSEDAVLDLKTTVAGSNATRASIGQGVFTPNASGGDKGADSINVKDAYDDGVQLLTQDTGFTTFSGATSRGIKDRMKNSVVIPDDIDCDMTGAVANFDTALATAYAEALSRTRGEVIIRPGRPKLGATCNLANTDTTKHVRIIGHGQATRVGNSFGNANWFFIGAAGATVAQAVQSRGIDFEALVFEASTAITAGAMFELRNARYMSWTDVAWLGVRQVFRLGIGATAINDVGSILLRNIGISNNGVGTVPMIDLGSGGSLDINGSMLPFVNGAAVTGAYLINQSDATWNWDGLWVHNLIVTDYDRALSSTGKGVTNMQWTGGLVDGANRAFFANSVSDANREWVIQTVQMLNQGGAVADYPLVWQGIGHVKMDNCTIGGYTGYVDIQTGAAYIRNNGFYGSGSGTGSGGTELIRFAAPHGDVRSNFYVPRSGFTNPINSVHWIAAAGSTRASSNNSWRTLTENGTV